MTPCKVCSNPETAVLPTHGPLWLLTCPFARGVRAAEQVQYFTPQVQYLTPQVQYLTPQVQYLTPQVQYLTPQVQYLQTQHHHFA
jgi:prefoldin subunit 5